MADNKELQQRRKTRLRFQLRRKAIGRPRLSVFRSGKHIYAQVIDDVAGCTLAAASSLDRALRESLKTGADKDAAAAVGKLVACARRWCDQRGLRSRILYLPWPRQGAGRGRP
jgi:large subunit ribosomal protein L18